MKGPKPARPSRPPQWPWEHGFLDERETSLVKAMAFAHPDGFRVVLEKLCRIHAMSFTAGGEEGRRATDFAEGMKFVGRMLLNTRDAKMPTKSRGAPPSDLPNAPLERPSSTLSAAGFKGQPKT